jgi:hypothetical protein
LYGLSHVGVEDVYHALVSRRFRMKDVGQAGERRPDG